MEVVLDFGVDLVEETWLVCFLGIVRGRVYLWWCWFF